MRHRVEYMVGLEAKDRRRVDFRIFYVAITGVWSAKAVMSNVLDVTMVAESSSC